MDRKQLVSAEGWTDYGKKLKLILRPDDFDLRKAAASRSNGLSAVTLTEELMK